jgi:putative endonuclease
MTYFIYILQSEKDGSYYVGSTQDLDSRLERHNQGRSQYTKSKRPWKLMYCEEHPDRSSAVKRENEIKRRKNKEYIKSFVECSRHT